MARPKKVEEAPVAAEEEKRSPLYKGFEKITVSLEPEQRARLHREGLQRAIDRGEPRPDYSAIVREALEFYWAKGGKR